jgi:hypothetical protein
MAKSKYGKYIVTKLKENVVEADWTPPMIRAATKGRGGRILFLDSEVVPGAFYLETVWVYLRPGESAGSATQPHKHDFDEVIGFFGTDPDDPYDLCGEIELWLGDEKHTFTRSCLVFIPKGLLHCPLNVIRADKPIFEFTTGPGKMYG